MNCSPRASRPTLITTAAACLLAASAWAAGEPAAEPPGTQSLTLLEIIRLGGVLMWVLGAISVVALALVLFYLLTLRREQVVPHAFAEEAAQAARHQGIDGLEAVCQRYDCPASRAILAGIQQIRLSGSTAPQLVLNAIQSEGARQAERLWRRIQYLLDIGVISPLVGFMGTVFGMIRSFNAIYLQYGTAKPVTLAGGIAQALITTAAGLVIAVPAMVLYSYFRGRTSALITQMEEVCARLAAYLVRDGQAAPREAPGAAAEPPDRRTTVHPARPHP